MLGGLEGVLELSELVIVLVAIALGSFIKGVSGSGLPQIAIPVIAIFLGVERAVVIMAIPGVLSNTWMMWGHRAAAQQTRDLPVLLIWGSLGVAVGTLGLTLLDPAVLSLALATMGGMYVLLHLVHIEIWLRPRVTRLISPPVGLLAGLLQGSTGVSGPLITTYLHAYRLPRGPFIFSTVTLYNVFAVAQVAALITLGLYDAGRVLESLLALIPMAVLLPLGARFSERLSQHRFDRILLVLIGMSVLALLYSGVTDLVG